MAEENVTTGNFESPVPEKTELERVQERIQNFKVQITPNVAQMASFRIYQHSSSAKAFIFRQSQEWI